ncbi:TatD family [Syncephalastrum racemosum]|uniref:TatD family n=1 Tax=Syncephalastrum racemosum TaxID=13706 RepID=A0A1X2HK43_SYNRA|nr:TatD family [Syncephalastrum racemosum]
MSPPDEHADSVDTLDTSLWELLCDAHCHPHDEKDKLDMILKLKTGRLNTMGVRQDDWDVVASLASRSEKCQPCFGIHPWFTHSDLETMLPQLKPPTPFETWYNDLRKRLETHPTALVGEVGLDRAARLLPGGQIEWHGVKPTTVQCRVEHQLAVFEAQLALARELNRAVSIHCVQGQGHLLQLLQKKPDAPGVIRICLHSFGGSPATIPQFINLKYYKVYVSFSTAINARLGEKLKKLIASIPEDRLLLETDFNTPIGLDEAMLDIARLAADARDWSLEHTIKQTHTNYQNFISGRAEE